MGLVALEKFHDGRCCQRQGFAELLHELACNDVEGGSGAHPLANDVRDEIEPVPEVREGPALAVVHFRQEGHRRRYMTSIVLRRVRTLNGASGPAGSPSP